jgi:hypothetical protein
MGKAGPGTRGGLKRGSLNHGHAPIRPDRVRRLPGAGGMGFSFVDRRLVREDRLSGLSPEAGVLYLFLVTVADQFGVSYYGEAKVAAFTGLPRGILFDLVRELIRADLLAYRHPVYQILSLPTGA